MLFLRHLLCNPLLHGCCQPHLLSLLLLVMTEALSGLLLVKFGLS